MQERPSDRRKASGPQLHAVERAGKIFTVLKQCAAQGLVCPTNAALGERFGVKTSAISNALHFLEANGMIEVERKSDRRVVTITATGHKTGERVTLKN